MPCVSRCWALWETRQWQILTRDLIENKSLLITSPIDHSGCKVNANSQNCAKKKKKLNEGYNNKPRAKKRKFHKIAKNKNEVIEHTTSKTTTKESRKVRKDFALLHGIRLLMQLYLRPSSRALKRPEPLVLSLHTRIVGDVKKREKKSKNNSPLRELKMLQKISFSIFFFSTCLKTKQTKKKSLMRKN